LDDMRKKNDTLDRSFPTFCLSKLNKFKSLETLGAGSFVLLEVI